DRLRAAAQAHVGGVGLGEQGQALLAAALPEQGAEALQYHVRARHPARLVQDLAVLLGHRRRGSAFPWPVEGPAFPRQVLEDPRGTEAVAVPGGQLLEHLDREARAQVVEVAEGPAQEGWEAQAVDRPHVAVPRRAQDALLQAERGLVEEREDQAVLDVARLEG